MRRSKVQGIALGVVGVWVLAFGALWFWSGLSIFVGTVSADCETIHLRALGAFFGREGGTCLALEDKSSWGIPGTFAALIVLVVGGVVLAGGLWVLARALDRWNTP